MCFGFSVGKYKPHSEIKCLGNIWAKKSCEIMPLTPKFGQKSDRGGHKKSPFFCHFRQNTDQTSEQIAINSFPLGSTRVWNSNLCENEKKSSDLAAHHGSQSGRWARSLHRNYPGLRHIGCSPGRVNKSINYLTKDYYQKWQMLKTLFANVWNFRSIWDINRWESHSSSKDP